MPVLLSSLQPKSQSFLFELFPMLNYEMWLVNTKMTQPHHWGTRYNQWVVNSRGLSMFSGPKNDEMRVMGEWMAIIVVAPLTACTLIPTHCLRVVWVSAEPQVARNVYLLGNPAVIWLTSSMILVWALTYMVYGRYRDARHIWGPRQARGLYICRYSR